MYDNLEQLRELLQLEKRRFAALAEHNRDGVILLGGDAQLLVANSLALNYLDLDGSPDAWVGLSFLDIVRDLRDRISNIATQTLEELHRIRHEKGHQGEGEYQIDSQSIHWLSLPILDDGLQLGQLVILRDVTEEIRLKAPQVDLVGSMVAGLKEPLGSVARSLRTLDPGAGLQLADDWCPTPQHAIDRAQSLLSSFTEFIEISALESGRMPLSPSAFSFPELVDHVLEMEQPFAEERHLLLEQHMPRTLPLTWGDRNLIQRLLRNLVSNALSFTPPGGTVDIEAAPEPHNVEKIQVTIGDTRRRTPQQLTDHVSQRFAAADQDRPGTDLRLAFCQLVLAAHGESIRFAQSSPAGTIVTFTLPQLSEPLSSIHSVQ